MVISLQTQLDQNTRALLGLNFPTGVFDGLTGLDYARVQQFEAFAHGEALSISGSEMGRENLQRLQDLSLEQYGITVEVDLEGGRFTLTNSNYIPMGLVSEEGRAALLGANNFASDCLSQADSLISQGRLDEADAYIRWAGAVQARYAEYMEGARFLEQLVLEKDGLPSLPSQGIADPGRAREKLGELVGYEISMQDFPAEFERKMGVTWEEFQDGGFASLVVRSIGDAISSMQQGLSALETQMRGMCTASAEAIIGADVQAYLPTQEYIESASFARDSAIFATEIEKDIFSLTAVRGEAEKIDGFQFEALAAQHADVLRTLGEERDFIHGMYAQAASSLSDSIFLRALIPVGEGAERTAEMESNYARAQEARLRGAEFLSRGEGMLPGLDAKYALASQYSRARDVLLAQDFENVGASDRAELAMERDDFVDEISAAMKEGREVENLEARIVVLDRRYTYLQIRDFWANYEFDGVEGVAGKIRLERDRGTLLDALEGALQSGGEIANLDGMQQDLLDTHEQCAAYERLVKKLYASQRERIVSIEGDFYRWNGSVSHGLGEMPGEVRGIMATPGYEGAGGHVDTNALLADFTQRKRQAKDSMFALGDEVRAGAAAQLGRLDTWYAEAMAYAPIDLGLDDFGSSISDLRERFSFDTNPAFAGLRSVHQETESMASRVSTGVAGISDSFNQMVNEFNGIVESQRSIAALYQVASALDMVGLATVGAWAVWNLPAVFAAGRSITNAGRSALAEIEAASPMAATGLRLGVTGLSLGLSVHGAVEFSEGVGRFRSAETADERVAAAEQMFEGALYIGSLGFASRLSPGLLRMARTVSIGLDATAIAAIAPSVASLGYAMSQRGDVSGWDIAEAVFWTGVGIAGAYAGIRVAGGIKAVFRGAEAVGEAKFMLIDEFARSIRAQAPPGARTEAAAASAAPASFRAESEFAQELERARAIEDPVDRAYTIVNIADGEARAGHDATALFKEAAESARALEDVGDRAYNIAFVATIQARSMDATPLFREAIDLLRTMPNDVRAAEDVFVALSATARRATFGQRYMGLVREAEMLLADARVAAGLESARAIENPSGRALAILNLDREYASVSGVHSVPLLEEATKSARMVEDPAIRATLLSSIALDYADEAGRAAGPLFREAVESANAMGRGAAPARAKIMSEIAASQAKAGLFDDAIETAKGIGWRTYTIDALCSVGSEQARLGVDATAFEDAAKSAREFLDLGLEAEYGTHMSRIASSQAEAGLYDDAIETARALTGDDRIRTLCSIGLEQAGAGVSATAFKEAAESARAIEDAASRAQALADVSSMKMEAGIGAGDLADVGVADWLDEAAESARMITPAIPRAQTLAHVAAVYAKTGMDAEPLFREAIATVRSIRNDYARALAAESVIESLQSAGASPALIREVERYIERFIF